MLTIKFPQWLITTPLDERVLDYAEKTHQSVHNIHQIANNIEYTDGNELLKIGNSLLNLKELLYLIVQYSHDHHIALNRFEASTMLWLMVYKDLLHGNRFLPTAIKPSEFVDSIPYAPYHMLVTTVTDAYAANHPTANITKVKPIETQISNPDKISNQILRQTYWQPVYDFYVNNCQGVIDKTDIVPDKSADNFPFTYRPNINCYSLSLQNWLNNNLPIAVAIVTNNSNEVLDAAAIINRYTDYATYNTYTHGPGSLRVLDAHQLNTHPGLTNHRKSVQQIIKFLNI